MSYHYCPKHDGEWECDQSLCSANHADEDIVLDKIGWNNFICPKCDRDYSIGRRIIILE